MRRFGAVLALTCCAACARPSKTLNIYFIDVEGGQSTLIVTPAGESLLIDTGFAANGFNDPSHRGRDPRRIAAAARDAGVNRIDFLLVTHFHPDHDGGVVDLAQMIPIRTFIDHGKVAPEADSVVGSVEAFKAYEAVRATGRHIEPKPGDRLPLKDIDAVVVSSDRSIIARPLDGAGERNVACAEPERPANDPFENPRSTGVRLRFGTFRFLDVGDLSGTPLFALACPTDLIGPVDVYLVAHHGESDAAEPATFAAFRPRVAILNNGQKKGGAPEVFSVLHRVAELDVWQLHRSAREGSANFAEDRIANLDETTDHWIKVSASEDGSFRVTNRRTGVVQAYAAPASLRTSLAALNASRPAGIPQ